MEFRQVSQIGVCDPQRGSADVRVSVCMATYNGERYVQEQLASILSELGDNDEVVVVDDCSRDATAQRVEGLDDPRIRVFRTNENAGHVRAFEAALYSSRGSFVFLSDQDDIWLPGRVELMIEALNRAQLVATNVYRFGAETGQFNPPLRAADSRRRIRNILGIFMGRRPYYGSGMAMRREFLSIALPFPEHVEAHDLWIAVLGNLVGGIEHTEHASLLRRVHSSNLSPSVRRPMSVVIRSRLRFCRYIVESLRRMRSRAICIF